MTEQKYWTKFNGYDLELRAKIALRLLQDFGPELGWGLEEPPTPAMIVTRAFDLAAEFERQADARELIRRTPPKHQEYMARPNEYEGIRIETTWTDPSEK